MPVAVRLRCFVSVYRGKKLRAACRRWQAGQGVIPVSQRSFGLLIWSSRKNPLLSWLLLSGEPEAGREEILLGNIPHTPH